MKVTMTYLSNPMTSPSNHFLYPLKFKNMPTGITKVMLLLTTAMLHLGMAMFQRLGMLVSRIQANQGR